VKLFKTLLAITVILLVQTMFLNRFQVLKWIDLFLLMNIYYALNFSQVASIGLSLCSGLVQDSFSQGVVGMNAFSKTVVAYLVSTLSSRLMIKHPLIIMLLIGISTSLDFLIIHGLRLLFGLESPLSYGILSAAALVNGVSGLVLFQITERIRVKKEYA